LSTGNAVRGPWNQGVSTQLGETFQFIEDPIKHVLATNGLLDQQPVGTDRTEEKVQKMNEELGEMKSEFVKASAPMGPLQWNDALIAQDLKEEKATQK
jgi:Mn-containing catalase